MTWSFTFNSNIVYLKKPKEEIEMLFYRIASLGL